MSGRKTTSIDQRRRREAIERERLERHRQAIEQARQQAEALIIDPAIQGSIAPTERLAIQQGLDALGRIRAGDLTDASGAEAAAAEVLRRISQLLGPARNRSRLAEQAGELRGRLVAGPRERALLPRFDRLRQGLDALLAGLKEPADGDAADDEAALASLAGEHRTLKALDAGVVEMRRFCDELRRGADWAEVFVNDAEGQLRCRLKQVDELTVRGLDQIRQAVFTAADTAFERHLADEGRDRQRTVEAEALRRAANRALYLTLSDEIAALEGETRRLCPGLLAQIEQGLSRLRRAIDTEQSRFDGDAALLRAMLAELPAQREQAAEEARARRERQRTALVEIEAVHASLAAGLDDAELGETARRHAEQRLAELGRFVVVVAARIGEQGLDQDIAALRAALDDFARVQQRKGMADQIRRLLLAADATGRITLDPASRKRLQVSLSEHVEVRALLGDTGEVLQLVVLQSEDGRLELGKLSDDEDLGCELFVDIARILEDAIGQPVAILDEYQEPVEVGDDQQARSRRDALAAKAADF